MRRVYERFKLLERTASGMQGLRSAGHTDHSLPELLCQRVYQVAAGYEDFHDRLAERGLLD